MAFRWILEFSVCGFSYVIREVKVFVGTWFGKSNFMQPHKHGLRISFLWIPFERLDSSCFSNSSDVVLENVQMENFGDFIYEKKNKNDFSLRRAALY